MVDEAAQHVIFRPLGVEELNALIDLQLAGLESDRIARRNLRHLLRSPTAYCLGAFVDSQLVGAGLLLFRSNSSIANLYYLVVHPEKRRRRMALRLVDALLQQARGQACRRVRLEVRMDNFAALRLYGLLGFEEVAMIPEYYNDGAHASVLERSLG